MDGLLEQPRLGELAAFAELGADGALEVILRQRALLLGGQERRAQGRVADVAAFVCFDWNVIVGYF